MVADTPFGRYYYNKNKWLSEFHVTYQGPLVALTPPVEVLNVSGLPAGNYTFHFGVDGNRNGIFDEPFYYDGVKASITP